MDKKKNNNKPPKRKTKGTGSEPTMARAEKKLLTVDSFSVLLNYFFYSKLGGLSKYLIMAFKDVHLAFSLINFVFFKE